MVAPVIEFTITVGTGFMHILCVCVCVFPSLDVKLSHDATCVPSTSSDDDGHPERSSAIVPGEPTGQKRSPVFGSYITSQVNIHTFCTITTNVQLLLNVTQRRIIPKSNNTH